MSRRERPWVTLPEAAEMLGQHHTAVYYRARKYGHVDGVPVVMRTPRQRVLSRAALERAIAGETTEPTPAPLPWDATTR